MKTSKLVDRIRRLLKKSPKETKLSKLYDTVKALKRKQKDLEHKLKSTDGKRERQRLKHKIDVLRVQRKKGARLYRDIKAQRR